MTENVEEQLSALADDELPAAEVPLLLRRVGRDEQCMRRLGRYYTMRAALRGELGPAADGDFAEQVAARIQREPRLQIAAEPAASASHSGRRRFERFARPLAGAAIAASVAIVAVGLWPAKEASRDSVPADTAAVVAEGSGGGERIGELARLISSSQSERVVRERWQRLDPRVQRRLQGYLVNHSENAVFAGPGGMLNYARIAGHAGAE